MKKLKEKFILILNVLIMAIVALSFFSTTITVNAENDVEITFLTSTKGKEYFTYTDNDQEIEKENGYIPINSKITLYATPNENNRFVYWLYTVNGVVRKLSDNDKVTVTVKQDYKFEAVYARENEFIVTFMNASDNVMEYQAVMMHENAKYVEPIHQKGYASRGWDKSLNDVTEDLVLKPVYKATVFSVFKDYAKDFFRGLGLTLAFSIIAVSLALFLGAILCLIRISDSKILSFLATAYIEVIRGVPLLLQLLLVYSLMPRVDYGKFLNSEIIAAVLALFLNSGAYVAEIFRSGIQAVDKGQMEAGRALGLSKWQTMRKIIMPQAIRNVLPSIGNELIAVIKETSLASSIDAGIGELMSVKKQITAASFINIPPFIVIAIMYFVVTFSLSKVVRLIERRLDNRD